MNSPTPEPWFSTEQKLMEDERGVERDALLEKLADYAGRVKRQMDAGVTPSEFTRLEQLRQGLEAAGAVVNHVWRRYHPA